MSTERVSDEELDKEAKSYRLACNLSPTTNEMYEKWASLFEELQQRRETDRKVIEACCKFKDGEINVHGLYKAISELLP